MTPLPISHSVMERCLKVHLIALAPFLLILTTWATPPNISISEIQEHAVKLRHSGDPTTLHGVEVTRDLQTWDLIGSSTPDASGFVFVDPLAFLKNSTHFYRLNTNDPESVHRWRNDYPIEYRSGEEMDALPTFSWQAFPLPGATYHFEISLAILDGQGEPVVLGHPLVSVSGLTSPELTLSSSSVSPFQISSVYAYRVIAELPARRIIGRWTPVKGFGFAHLTESPFGPTPLGGGESPSYQPHDWATLLKLLNKLAAEKIAIHNALAENDLVEETALIRQLVELLKSPPELKEILETLLSNPETLTDPEATLKALCFLDELLGFVTLYDDNLSANKKEHLKRFKTNISKLKKNLETAKDRQGSLPGILKDLKGFLDKLKKEDENPLDYLNDLVKEKLLEKLNEMLAKKIGKKAAGAIVSIITDLISLGDLLLKLYQLDELCTEYNRLLLAGIANDPTGSTIPTRLITSKIRESDLNRTTITIAYKKLCWKPEATGDSNEGHWEVSEVSLADGTTSTSSPASEFHSEKSPDGRICLSKTINLDPSSLQCPPGAGPCIVFSEITKSYTNPSHTSVTNLFAGVIRCP